MPFCPHCGKPSGDQATQCVACGKPISAAPGGSRGGFKGTMMMTSPAALADALGADGAGTADPERQPGRDPGEGAHVEAPKAAPVQEPGKRPSALKATMIGGMAALGDLGSRSAAAATAPNPAPVGPPPGTRAGAPARESKDPAFARTAPAETNQTGPAADDGAPQQPPGAPGPAPRPRVLPEQGIYPAESQGGGGARWILAGALGVLVIAALGALAAKLLGLL